MALLFLFLNRNIRPEPLLEPSAMTVLMRGHNIFYGQRGKNYLFSYIPENDVYVAGVGDIKVNIYKTNLRSRGREEDLLELFPFVDFLCDILSVTDNS